jgi:hypothetical protein
VIDMIANVFNVENQIYRDFGINERKNVFVLTALTQKFKQILYKKYQVEFQRYLQLKHSHHHHNHHHPTTNETIFCDLRLHNSSHYAENFSDFSSCLREMKRRCSNYTNVDINSFCMNITSIRKYENSSADMTTKTTTTTTFNKQLLFSSEHLNLFDFVTSILSRNNKSITSSSMNASNQESNYQFDFIVLDFKSMLNDSFVMWRPLLILEQNELDRKLFTMHHALEEPDWLSPNLIGWKCEKICWSVIAASIFILLILIVVISLSVGIAAR